MSKETLFWPEEIMVWPVAEDLSISEWAAKYRVLGAHSAIKGPYLLEMVPFFAFLMDKIQDPSIQTIVLCKPAQIGGTDACLCVVGYYAHQEGCPIMCVLADQDTAEYVSNEKIKVMLESSETMAALIDSDCYTKTEMKLFNGAYFAIAWATSVAKLASRPIRIVYLDEIDKPGYSLTTREANPISLARERSNTFPDRKHLLTSTPTTEAGNIIRELESCDLVFDWHVPCPLCGQLQILRWNKEHCYGLKDGLYRAEDGTMHPVGMVVWEGGTSASNQQIMETARYQCGECEQSWTTAQKNEAVRQGLGIPRSEPTGWERKIGMHVNRIYSLFDGGRLEEVVMEFIHSRRVPEHERMKALQGFINSSLAEPWVQIVTTTTDTSVLAARCALPAMTAPAETVALTCGIDSQKHGFWFAVRAWARNYTSWLIHYGQLADFDELEQLLFGSTYPVDGDPERSLHIWRAAIDTGGGSQGADDYNITENVYHWVRKVGTGRSCRVFACKGSSSPLGDAVARFGKAKDWAPSGKPLPGGLQLVMVDSAQAKDMVHTRLANAVSLDGLQAFLHAETDQIYLRHITAEEKRRDRRGNVEWVQLRRDNHLLDAEGLAMALAEPTWPGGGINIVRGGPSVQRPQKPTHETPNMGQPTPQQSAGRRINPWAKRR